jgi:hypothetical protein
LDDHEEAQKETSQDDKKKLEEEVDNPISEYFAHKHPEVVKVAQQRHYGEI